MNEKKRQSARLYVCQAKLEPGSFGARSRRRLEHCSIPSQKVVYVTEMIIYDLFLFNLPLATIPAVIIAAAAENSSSTSLSGALIFGARNFQFQMYVVRKTGAENWRQKCYLLRIVYCIRI